MSKQENKFAEIVKDLEVVETAKSGELKGGFQALEKEDANDGIIINVYQCSTR
ncbi:hypothetical protein [Faecalibacter rhinopitheci]|uniref:Uncharacterized protein n=1 Tax=Faecalibacter rhinopitheci TaxID=2779678 RepID=A0A8J7FPF5_9FLAO|nr:hypothetical protein [Faecalibacter rhinopitheci]MBF0598297.1 hypothetical protein [Faecalibacter rhinopitheci]